ncbi:MmgE/PrpD family protein [Ramlibacter sp. 2FC]|uniref:MmgE/PrpD family protein n=1 Tax=Ramlibacter sp. 2FC TaxID=2502188 RepID=UPI0010F8B340|nr:MmgE/PrpD family protein [Ramlibacter sp. 2FC]
MPTSTDLCHHIADFIVNTRYDKLPQDAVEGAKKSILDTLGVILAAGGMEPAVRGIVEFAKESGGRPESSVLGFGGRVPAVMAAFVNGAMAHCLDYDDQTPWGQHSASSLIPAVFAVAERVAAENGAVSGKDMIAAVAAGQDLFNRFRRFVDWRKDWNFSTVMGVYCATAASGLLLGLSREQVTHALGIASMQSCGTAAVLNAVGSDLRAMYAGFPARGAVTAALLAQKGITGVPTIFEGKFGVFDMYFGNKYDRKSILDGLGTDYTGGLTLYKRWPAVGTAHSHIHATISLMNERGLDAADIDEIRVFVGDYHRLMSEPLEARRSPTTLVDAKFSLPFLVAVAAVRRDMSLDDFTQAALKDPEVLAVARKVLPVDDATLDWKLELPPGRVEIVMRDGRRFERVGTDVPGSVEAPMDWDDIVRKFSNCASFAPARRSAEQLSAVHQMVRTLEQVKDATEVLRALS